MKGFILPARGKNILLVLLGNALYALAVDMFVLPCAETKIMPPPPRQMGIIVFSTLCRFCSCHSLPPERKEKTIRMVARPMKGKNF